MEITYSVRKLENIPCVVNTRFAYSAKQYEMNAYTTRTM